VLHYVDRAQSCQDSSSAALTERNVIKTAGKSRRRERMPPDVTTINIGLCYQLATKFTEIIALVSRVIRNRQTDVNTRK